MVQVNWSIQPVSVGWIIALLVLLVVIVLFILGQIDHELAAFLAALAIARLV